MDKGMNMKSTSIFILILISIVVIWGIFLLEKRMQPPFFQMLLQKISPSKPSGEGILPEPPRKMLKEAEKFLKANVKDSMKQIFRPNAMNNLLIF